MPRILKLFKDSASTLLPGRRICVLLDRKPDDGFSCDEAK